MAQVGCTNCNAPPTVEAIRSGQCSFCGSALQHVVDAASKAAVLKELLIDRDRDGVPDILQESPAERQKQANQLAVEQQKQAAASAAVRAKQQRAQHLAQLRSNVLKLEQTRLRWDLVLGVTLAGAIMASIVIMTVGVAWLDTDPWLGGYADLVCPKICAGCRAPLRDLSWSVNGKSGGSIWYCDHPNFVGGDWMTTINNKSGNARYKFPGGLAHLWAVSFATTGLPILFLALAFELKRRTKKRAEAPNARSLLAAAEAQNTTWPNG